MEDTRKITWEIMTDLIRQEFDFVCRGKWNGKQVLRGVQLWDGSPETDKRYMYLNLSYSAETPAAKYPSNIVTLADGEKPRKNSETSSESCIFCGQNTRLYVLNRILQIYTDCREWQMQIQDAARQEKDLRSLIALCTRYLHVSTAIVNSAYEIGAEQDAPGMGFHWSEMRNPDGRMTEESIEGLYLNDPSFEETFFKTELTFFKWNYDTEATGHGIYYYNFMDEEDRYLGRILFATQKKNPGKGILELFDFASKEAAACFLSTMHVASPTKISRRLHQLFDDLLEQKSIGQMEIETILEADGWHSTDEYQIMKMVSYTDMRAAHTLTYYCHLLERDFPNICAIERNSSIYCLIHLTVEEEKNHFSEKLPYFLRENLFLAGLSCLFENLSHCRIYAQEAGYALAIGQRSGNVRWLHRFEETSLEYCLEKMCEEYPIADLMHPGLQKLTAYDTSHPGAELTNTLRTYLRHQQNATHTADLLHIHRTTLLYRLHRIRELTGIVPEDARTRLHLELSFALEKTDQALFYI